MRILHTSDWHVGRTFHGRDLLVEQESVLSGLADLVSSEKVDVVVISGDLYDRAVPSADAVSLCARVLMRIRAAGARIVITPGNHDSAARIGVFGEFAEAGGLHLRTQISLLDKPVELEDAHGPVGGAMDALDEIRSRKVQALSRNRLARVLEEAGFIAENRLNPGEC